MLSDVFRRFIKKYFYTNGVGCWSCKLSIKNNTTTILYYVMWLKIIILISVKNLDSKLF